MVNETATFSFTALAKVPILNMLRWSRKISKFKIVLLLKSTTSILEPSPGEATHNLLSKFVLSQPLQETECKRLFLLSIIEDENHNEDIELKCIMHLLRCLPTGANRKFYSKMLSNENAYMTILVPRVFLRHTLITKPNEHPSTLRSNAPRIWVH